MTELKFTTPSVGEKNTVAEPLVDTALNEIKSFINGNKLDGTTNLKAEGVKESNLEKALQEKLTVRLGFVYEAKNASGEGVTEKFYFMEKEGSTLTLPAPTVNRIIGVYCSPTSIKVTASAGKIYGDFIEPGETTVTLMKAQHLIVLATGSNWLIIAGEPKREQKYVAKTYTKAEAEAGVELSATREAFITFTVGAPSEIGGVVINTATPLACLIPPGQKWKGTLAVEANVLLR